MQNTLSQITHTHIYVCVCSLTDVFKLLHMYLFFKLMYCMESKKNIKVLLLTASKSCGVHLKF